MTFYNNNWYFHLLETKMFWYGHPLVNQGAGRIKTDSLNEQRIETALNRFEEWANERGILKSFKYGLNKEQMEKSRIVFPLAGFAVKNLTKWSSAFWHHGHSCTPTQNTSANVSRYSQQSLDTTSTCTTSRHIMQAEDSAISTITQRTFSEWSITTTQGTPSNGWKIVTRILQKKRLKHHGTHRKKKPSRSE